jgi:hypothetical protein
MIARLTTKIHAPRLTRLLGKCHRRSQVCHEPGARREGVPTPGHKLPLRGNIRSSLGLALLADSATRGFDISCLTAVSLAASAFFITLLLAILDHCTEANEKNGQSNTDRLKYCKSAGALVLLRGKC